MATSSRSGKNEECRGGPTGAREALDELTRNSKTGTYDKRK